MASSKSLRRSSSTNQSISSSTNSRKTSTFPLPNATKPRYVVPKKLELNELPDDILLNIFRYLSPVDLLNIGVVCRRWYAVGQDESLWRSLAIAYDLHQKQSPLNSKQRIQAYLNDQIKMRLKSLFPTKFDPLKSYTGIPDYQKVWDKASEKIEFHLALCDEKHQTIWSKKSDTLKHFDTSLSVRWFDLTLLEILPRVHYLRLFSTIFIDITTRPNRTRLPRANEQLADVTEKPLRHQQRIQSLLHEYKFHWNTIKSTLIPLTNDLKSPIRVSQTPNEDDYLLATYDKDRSYAFLVCNLNYLSFHEAFFTGLRVTTSLNTKPLSHLFTDRKMLTIDDSEVSVFLCFRNITTIFLRHRFPHCRVKFSPSSIIEIVRRTDMAEELGVELEQLPKFNWKTEVCNGTIADLFLIDLVVLNERQQVSLTATLPAQLIAANIDGPSQGSDYILSSNIWNFQAVSQCNNRMRLDGTIMRLDDEYCSLGKTSQSWHLQRMTCQF